jgi:hypothetical protein
MKPMLTMKEIEEKYKDCWVVMTEWEEDEVGDVIKGNVIYHDVNRKTFYEYIKNNVMQRSIATRYTGNVKGPFFLQR